MCKVAQKCGWVLISATWTFELGVTSSNPCQSKLTTWTEFSFLSTWPNRAHMCNPKPAHQTITLNQVMHACDPDCHGSSSHLSTCFSVLASVLNISTHPKPFSPTSDPLGSLAYSLFSILFHGLWYIFFLHSDTPLLDILCLCLIMSWSPTHNLDFSYMFLTFKLCLQPDI